jgi:hypothetical protein
MHVVSIWYVTENINNLYAINDVAFFRYTLKHQYSVTADWFSLPFHLVCDIEMEITESSTSLA